MRVLCITPVIGDPKDSKRISLLQEIGAVVTVASFERDYFKSRVPDAPIVTLAQIEHAKYFTRIFIYLKVIFTLRKLSTNADVVYTFSPDLAVLAFVANAFRNKPLVVDVADIRSIQLGKSIISKVYRMVDKYITRRASLLVVTAKAFDDWYYQKLLKIKTNTLVLENKVDYALVIPENRVLGNKKLTIGYFGVIRSQWSIHFLNRLAQSKLFNVQISGIFLFNNNNEVKRNLHPDIKYTGTFRSPDDLADIYSGVDVILAVYPEPFEKLTYEVYADQICRSNRFYEACYFQKPILSMKDSGDAVAVLKHNIGLVFDSYDFESCMNSMAMIDERMLQTWQQNLQKLDKNIYLLNNEKEELKVKLKEITS